jgi:hypothetical protein
MEVVRAPGMSTEAAEATLRSLAPEVLERGGAEGIGDLASGPWAGVTETAGSVFRAIPGVIVNLFEGLGDLLG